VAIIDDSYYIVSEMSEVFLILWILCVIMTLSRVSSSDQPNIYGRSLEICSTSPLTGWFRDGYCRTDRNDRGVHVVCATMTQDFLTYTRNQGNDLSTPHPPSFPGLKPGDRWALCAGRWYEAFTAGFAPLVKLDATHRKALETIPLEVLEQFDDRRLSPANNTSGRDEL